MSDIVEHFNSFAAHMSKTTYRDFVNTDLEYQEIECYLVKNKERYNNIMNSLSEEDRQFTEDYISKQSYRITCANEWLYIASYKDCIKLLKLIGVI